LDEAAAYVNASRPNWPPEVIQAQESLKSNALRLENAIGNHEFERARFYSQEQAKARQELNQLLKKQSPGEAVRKVTGRDVKEVLARWLNVPLSSLEQGEGEVNRGND
jgi:ATP-dependent Clp protease ATP-binding subunit ClpC